MIDKSTFIYRLFSRVCKDSGYNLSRIEAAGLVANIADVDLLDVWYAVGGWENASKIAQGSPELGEEK